MIMYVHAEKTKGKCVSPSSSCVLLEECTSENHPAIKRYLYITHVHTHTTNILI